MRASVPSQGSRVSIVGVFRGIGALGAVLAFTILGASILLRLNTRFGVDGVPYSVLLSEYENAIRMVHRLTASSLGILALVTAILGWSQRKSIPHAVQAVVFMVCATVLLAVIGPLTPGYRYSAVTIANVVAGTVLLAACWWLWEVHTDTRALAVAQQSQLRLTLAILLLHIGLGAAASDSVMRGVHWVSFVHSGSAMLVTLLIGSMLWDARQRSQGKKVVVGMAALLVLQIALGLVSLWIEGHAVGLGVAHAMVSPILVAGLLSLVVRGSR